MIRREPDGVNRHRHILALLLLLEELVELLEPLVVTISLTICEEHHNKFRALLSVFIHRVRQNVKTWAEIGTSSHIVALDVLQICCLIVSHRWMSNVIVEDRVNFFKHVLALITISAEDDLAQVEAGLLERLKWSSAHRSTLIVEKHEMLSLVRLAHSLSNPCDFLELRLGQLRLNLSEQQLLVFC